MKKLILLTSILIAISCTKSSDNSNFLSEKYTYKVYGDSLEVSFYQYTKDSWNLQPFYNSVQDSVIFENTALQSIYVDERNMMVELKPANVDSAEITLQFFHQDTLIMDSTFYIDRNFYAPSDQGRFTVRF